MQNVAILPFIRGWIYNPGPEGGTGIHHFLRFQDNTMWEHELATPKGGTANPLCGMTTDRVNTLLEPFGLVAHKIWVLDSKRVILAEVDPSAFADFPVSGDCAPADDILCWCSIIDLECPTADPDRPIHHSEGVGAPFTLVYEWLRDKKMLGQEYYEKEGLLCSVLASSNRLPAKLTWHYIYATIAPIDITVSSLTTDIAAMGITCTMTTPVTATLKYAAPIRYTSTVDTVGRLLTRRICGGSASLLQLDKVRLGTYQIVLPGTAKSATIQQWHDAMGGIVNRSTDPDMWRLQSLTVSGHPVWRSNPTEK